MHTFVADTHTSVTTIPNKILKIACIDRNIDKIVHSEFPSSSTVKVNQFSFGKYHKNGQSTVSLVTPITVDRNYKTEM